MLLLIVGLVVLLIFPIMVNFKALLSITDKKLYFIIQLFGFIKIIGGYANFDKSGIAIHIKNDKAFILLYKNIFSVKDKIKPLKDYHLIKFRVVIDVGAKNDFFNALTVSNYISIFSFLLKDIVINNKPYFEYDTKINVIKTLESVRAFFNFAILFNGLVVIISLIKIMIGKILYGR